MKKELIERVTELRDELLANDDFNNQYQEAKKLLLSTLGVDIESMISWFDSKKEQTLIVKKIELERVLRRIYGNHSVEELGIFGTLTLYFGKEITDKFKTIIHSGWVDMYNKIQPKCKCYCFRLRNGLYTVNLPHLKKYLSEEEYIKYLGFLQYLHGDAVLDAINYDAIKKHF